MRFARLAVALPIIVTTVATTALAACSKDDAITVDHPAEAVVGLWEAATVNGQPLPHTGRDGFNLQVTYHSGNLNIISAQPVSGATGTMRDSVTRVSAATGQPTNASISAFIVTTVAGGTLYVRQSGTSGNLGTAVVRSYLIGDRTLTWVDGDRAIVYRKR